VTLLVLTSASGSPGVTTSALGLALTWPRPVLLVEADPTGGSALLAGYFRGKEAHARGLLDLAWAHRDGTLAETVTRLAMPVPGTSVSMLPGVRAHGQARNLATLWEPLAAALRALAGQDLDVIVDAGRLGLAHAPEPLLYAADLTLLAVRSDLVALSAARSWAETLQARFADLGADRGLGLLLIGPGRPYTARNVAKVLQVPVVASLAWDEKAAAVFSRGAPRPRRFTTSPLPSSLRAAGGSVIDAVGALSGDAVSLAAAGGRP